MTQNTTYRIRHSASPYRQGAGRPQSGHQPYIYGNAARKLEMLPDKSVISNSVKHLTYKRKTAKPDVVQRPKKQTSKAVLKNRAAAKSMSPGFVIFLSLMSVVLIFCCISYLQAKSGLTYRIKEVANAESQLAEMRQDNTAYEAQLNSSVDINKVKEIAIKNLGMKYPSNEQKMTYKLDHEQGYVKQYIFDIDKQ